MPDTSDTKPELLHLTSTDHVAPSVLIGRTVVPIDVPDSALGESRRRSASEVFGLSDKQKAPAWILGFHAANRIEVENALASFLPQGQESSFAISLEHWLDPWTFLGQPSGGRVPVLLVRIGEQVQQDAGGDAFVALLRRYLAGGQELQPPPFEVELRPVSAFPRELRSYEPFLGLEETWRLVSIFQDLSVGQPAGSAALLPGEARTLNVKRTQKYAMRKADKGSFLDRATDEWTGEFSQDWTEIARSERGRELSTAWTSQAAAPAQGAVPAITTSEERKLSSTVKDFAEVTRKAVAKVTAKRTREVRVELSSEFERSEEVSTETSRKVEVSNPSNYGVTHVFHHLDARYRVVLELTGVELVLSGAPFVRDRRRISLDGKARTALEQSLPSEAPVAEIWAAVLKEFAERYDSLDLLQGDGATLELKPRRDGDPRLSIYSRQALEADRPRTGGLPVTVDSHQPVLQTEHLHPVPYLSRYGVPDPPTPTASPKKPQEGPPGGAPPN